uniref:Uncharacterized protein n=1 Tax=Setaria viridis TaxID=4556 RepID=A0A4U6TSG7_SETVI|nr:hypothetical protein SEVIR_7G208650v2 [Setaria viridis]
MMQLIDLALISIFCSSTNLMSHFIQCTPVQSTWDVHRISAPLTKCLSYILA